MSIHESTHVHTLGIQSPNLRGTCKPNMFPYPIATALYFLQSCSVTLSTLAEECPCLSGPHIGCLLCRQSRTGVQDELIGEEPRTLG